MKNTRNLVLTLGLSVLVLSACEQQSVTSVDSTPDSNPVAGLDVSDGTPDGDGTVAFEQFEICKYGGDALFDWSVSYRAGGSDGGTDLAVEADECFIIATAGGLGADVSVTEHVPSGYQLDSYDVTVITGTPASPVSTTTTYDGPWVGADDVTVSDFISGTSGGGLRGVLVEFTNALCTASLGDFVWDDLNGDGIQDTGEPGLAGVTVNLYDAGSVLMTSDVTDAAGAYLFTDLCSGDYSVGVDLTTLPAGYAASPTLQGTDPTVDSNPNPFAVTLVNATSDLTIDFGYTPPPPPEGGEGCTPGYWKQEHHFDSWTAPLDPTAAFTAPGFTSPGSDARYKRGKNEVNVTTQLHALQANQGYLAPLTRHAMAALLNAASPSVSYAYSTAQVIQMYNNAVGGSLDPETVKDDLAYENEMGCPLN